MIINNNKKKKKKKDFNLTFLKFRCGKLRNQKIYHDVKINAVLMSGKVLPHVGKSPSSVFSRKKKDFGNFLGNFWTHQYKVHSL